MDDNQYWRIGLVAQARRMGIPAQIVRSDGREMIMMDVPTFETVLSGYVPTRDGQTPSTADSTTLAATVDVVVAAMLGGRVEIRRGGALVSTARDQQDAMDQVDALRRMDAAAGLDETYTTRPAR